MKHNCQESNELYKKVVEAQTELICRFQPNGVITFVNDAYCRYFGMKQEEILGGNFLPLLLVEDVNLIKVHLAKLCQANPIGKIEYKVILTNGELRWLERIDRAIFDQNCNLIEYQSVGRDITERKFIEIGHQNHLDELIRARTAELATENTRLKEIIAKENAAKQVLEKYRVLAESVKDIILFVNSNWCIVEANASAVEAYGYTREELLALTVFDLRVDPQAIVIEQLKYAEKSGQLFETVHRRKDGTLFDVEVSLQPAIINGERLTARIIRDISDRKRMQNELYYLSRYDRLTELPNRHYLDEFLAAIRSQGLTATSAFFLIDLDNFKIVNDTYGFAAGDAFLKKFAQCIKVSMRENDFIARIDGDEFAAFLPNIGQKQALKIAHHILETFEMETFCFEDACTSLRVTASIGCTMIYEDVELENSFLYAGSALCIAKEKGKNRVIVIQNEQDKIKASENSQMLNAISEALQEERFLLYFQPIYRAGNGILHYEALIRMVNDKGDILPPATFIPLAEKYGIMHQIDHWMINKAIEVLENNRELSVFVNLSGASLDNESLLKWIEGRIMDSEINPEQLGFEITETAAIKDLAQAEQWIRRIKAVGCCFALDDFGVGFSSFSQLHLLPVDYLKIDGSFIKELDTDPTKRALVQAMSSVAHALNKKTIAEFVENEEVWRILQELGVDCGQGYYLSKPKPYEDFL